MDAKPDIQILIKYVTDTSSTERVNSIDALGAMRCVDACECLKRALRDRNRQVRMSALRALEAIGEPAYPQIVHGLKFSSADVRELAAEVLGRMINVDAVFPLTEALGDQDKLVRLSAVRALANLGTPKAIKALIIGLRAPNSDVQQAVKAALIKAGPQACRPLRDACDDSDVRIRKPAAEILSKIENAQQTEDRRYSVKICERCNCLFKTSEQDENEEFCSKCLSELNDVEHPEQAEAARYSLKTCVRCNSLFETDIGDASEVLCKKCRGEQDRNRVCKYCLKTFKPRSKKQRFCSLRCLKASIEAGINQEDLELPAPAPHDYVLPADILSKIEQSQKAADVLQEGPYTEVQSQVDDTKNRLEVDTNRPSDSTEDLAKVTQDRINDVFKRRAKLTHEQEVIAERAQIPIDEASKTVPPTPPPGEAHDVINVTELPTSIKLEASTTNPLINEAVTIKVALTAGNTPLSKPVTVWHTWEGIRYDDVTKESPFTLAKVWQFAAERHYCATFAGDAIHAASTSAVLDINVGTRASTETAVTLEASGKHPSITESDAELPTPSAESLMVDETSKAAHYSLKTCVRCNSLFETHEQDADEVVCDKCISEFCDLIQRIAKEEISPESRLDMSTPSPKRYWIEKTLVKGRTDRISGDYALGKALWSPQARSDGHRIYAAMQAVRTGDIVLHLSDNEGFSGTSIIASSADPSFIGLEGTEWAGRAAYLVRLNEYVPLEIPLLREEFLYDLAVFEQLANILDAHKGKGLFYNRNRNLNQGAYLTWAPAELVSVLNTLYRVKTGKNLPHVDLPLFPEPKSFVLDPLYTRDLHEVVYLLNERVSKKICDSCEGEYHSSGLIQRFCSHSCSVKARSVMITKREEPVKRILTPHEGLMNATPETRALIKRVADTSSADRVLSIYTLGAMRCLEACDCLGNVLEDKDQQVRITALRALEDIGEPAYPQIVHGLKFSSADIRELAAEVLGRMINVDAVSPLTDALQDRDKLVRLSAVRALNNVSSDEAIRALIIGLKDPDGEVQQAAKRALIKARPLAYDSLRNACDDDVRLREPAADILGKIEVSQKVEDVQHQGPCAEVQSQTDNNKNPVELDTKAPTESPEDLAKVIQDRINDVFKRRAALKHESEITAERAQIPMHEVSKNVPSAPSSSDPRDVVNVTDLPTSIKLEVSSSNPVIHEAVTFTATLIAGNTPLSKSVTIWHTLKGARYNDITMESPCTVTKDWRFAGVRHYYATFAGDGTHAASTSSVLDINVGAHASVETAVKLEASGKPPSISESGEEQLAFERSPLDVSFQKRCQRCDSVFEPHGQDASQVLCNKCINEQNAAAVDAALGLKTCAYCKRKFIPNDVSKLTGFCSKACSAKAQDVARIEEELTRPNWAQNEGPLAVHVAGQPGVGPVAASAQNLDLSCERPNWSFETLLSAKIAQYEGPYKDIVAFAVPFYKLLCELLNDVLVNWHTKIMISSALGYLVLAEDVIPDHKEHGLIDDVFIMAHVLRELKEHFSERIEENWGQDEDICATVDRIHDACNDLVQSQAWEILQRVGLQKFQDLELEEYSGKYPKRFARVAQEKRELLGLLAYVMRQMGYKKVDRSRVENIRRRIEHSGNAAEINRIIELAKKDHNIKIEDKEFEDFKEEYEREMNEMQWK